jgi:hypothetical protein
MSNLSSRLTSSHRVRCARALLLALTVGAAAGGCTEEEASSPELAAPSTELAPPLSSEQLAARRTPITEPTEAERKARAESLAALEAQAARAQAYADAHVTPRLDRALRETAGLSYPQLQAELLEALNAAGDDEVAIRAALDHFRATRGAAIDAAAARLGTTVAALGDEIRAAALGDAKLPQPAPATPPQRLGGCFTGHEFEPFPPFFQAGNWFVGVNSANLPTANVNGTIHAEANLVVGGTAQVAGWVRADNIPPAGAGTTTVSTSVAFSTMISELSIWVPSYAGSGVGLSIRVMDGGPGGTFLGECRLPMLDAGIPVGYYFTNRSRFVTHSCSFHHGPSTFLTATVNVDTYGTSLAPFGSVARAVADANIQTIRYVTCLD